MSSSENVLSALAAPDEIARILRTRRGHHVEETINKARLEEYVAEGWEVKRENKQTYRMRKAKAHDVMLEDRTWVLLAKLGFDWMSPDRNFRVRYADDPKITAKQIDVFAADPEAALVVECKSAESPRTKRSLQKDIAELLTWSESSRRKYLTFFAFHAM